MGKRKRVVKRFTLLEIMISLAILSLCLGYVGISISSVIKEYAFKNACASLHNEFAATRRLSSLYETPMEVKLTVTEKGLLFERWCDNPFPVDKNFFTCKKKFSTIRSLKVGEREVLEKTYLFSPRSSPLISLSLSDGVREDFLGEKTPIREGE